MSSIKSELIQLAALADRKFTLPRIRQVFMPEPRPAVDKDSEFGMVVLEDGSAGLYYAWMGEAQSAMNERYATVDFVGMHAVELVQYFNSDHEADRSLGLAAINAISQSVFRQSGYQLATAGNSIGELDVKTGDHIGMVGYFPSLVRQLREQNIRLTVIEKKAKFIQSDALVDVTMDVRELVSCNKILSTASTLLNDSIDEILGYTRNAENVVLVGPTAGFFPDPLFERGVSAIGGAEIVDVDLAIARLSNEQGLGESARKYILKKKHYPGAAALFSEN